MTNSPADSFHGRTLGASLTVKDLETSLHWYQDVVGFTVERKYEREGKLLAIALRAGDIERGADSVRPRTAPDLLITQDDGAKGLDRVKGEGFSLQITTDQNIDEIANRIKEHGGKLDMEPTDTPWGVRAFRLHDPDGFKFVISSARSS